MSYIPKLGITIGDINGIGLEVILKTFEDTRLLELCQPIIYGSSKTVSYHKNIVEADSKIQFHSIDSVEEAKEGVLNVLNCWNEAVKISLGEITAEAGACAFKSLEHAVRDVKAGRIDGIVTAPIHKRAMQLAGFEYPGHTEYLTQQDEADESLMFLVDGELRVGLVSNHLPIQKVAEALSSELILRKLQLMHDTLREDFGIDRPKIAVLGLNPHAGDEGAIGDEEKGIVAPAIELAAKEDILAFGPYPADGFFGSNTQKKFDAVLAMYHDQGLIPFKILAFGAGVNFTAGLELVRCSPDHGTAFDIAGKNLAKPYSFRQAVFLTIDIIRHRAAYAERYANPLDRQQNKRRSKRRKGGRDNIKQIKTTSPPKLDD